MRKTPIYSIGDKVWLEATHIDTGRPMKKLDNRRLGPYEVQKVLSNNTYELKLREQRFHGVAALRLTPVGGGGVYGRTGLLAHTYMLGPNGQSNGCVSFRDYPKFLRAYLRGEIDRIVVVSRLTRAPASVARGNPRSSASAL